MLPCPPPDKNLRRPQFVLPKESWDCQAHIFGPFDKFPLGPDRNYTPAEHPLEQYIELLDSLGIDRGVIVQGGAHGTDNRAMLDALARKPDRFRGVAVIQPGLPQAKLLEMDRLGVRGMRMSTMVGGGVMFDKLSALAEEAVALNWHVALHFLHATELLAVEDYLRTCPSKILLDHMARVSADEGINSKPFQALLRLLDRGNVWVRLSSIYRLSSQPYPYEDMLPMIHKVIAERPDRMLWGTNWPHPIIPAKTKMPNDADLVDLVPLWIPSAVQRELVLVQNPLELFR